MKRKEIVINLYLPIVLICLKGKEQRSVVFQRSASTGLKSWRLSNNIACTKVFIYTYIRSALFWHRTWWDSPLNHLLCTTMCGETCLAQVFFICFLIIFIYCWLFELRAMSTHIKLFFKTVCFPFAARWQSVEIWRKVRKQALARQKIQSGFNLWTERG